MASQPTTVSAIVLAASAAGAVSARKMFGEFALYCDGKLVALICDDRLFLKPTAPGRALEHDRIALSRRGIPVGAEMWFKLLAGLEASN